MKLGSGKIVIICHYRNPNLIRLLSFIASHQNIQWI